MGSIFYLFNFNTDDTKIVVRGNVQRSNPKTGATDYSGFVKLINMESKKVEGSFGEHNASIKSIRITPDEKIWLWED